jgi:hypothetical protein
MMTITREIDTDSKPFLIDFGIASRFDEDVYGFRGTPQYAHRSVFKKYTRTKWRAVGAYDHSSLAFSIASLLKEGRSPWRSLHPCTLKPYGTLDTYNIWADERSNAAQKVLKEAKFPEGHWKTYGDDNARKQVMKKRWMKNRRALEDLRRRQCEKEGCQKEMDGK